MNILAIDPGTTLGWALRENGRVEYGHEDLSFGRHESRGMRWVKFNRWLEEMRPRVGLIIYEQQHHRGGPATEVGMGFVTRIHEFCARHGIDYTSLHTSRLKKWSTGKGNASKDDMKLAASQFVGFSKTSMEWARFMDAITDDEADAICLLKWAEALRG